MKIKYKDVEHEAVINEKGHVVSKTGNQFFGYADDALIPGATEVVEPQDAPVIEESQ